MNKMKVVKNKLIIEYNIKHDSISDNIPDFKEFLLKNNAELEYSNFNSNKIISIKYGNIYYGTEELGQTLFEIIFNFANRSIRDLKKVY